MTTDTSKLSQANWINWDEVIERVRKAKTPEVAIARLKKDLDLAFKLYSGDQARKAVAEYKHHQQVKRGMKRAQAMAQAMAYREGEEAEDFLELAVRIDRALTARKEHEI